METRLRGAWISRGAITETYSQERVYAARENHRFASKSAEFMAPPTPAARLMRDAVLVHQ